MTPITFTALFMMITCVIAIAVGFLYIGYQEGVARERLRSKRGDR